ncbi:hypothetical protein PLEOSDRAFT_1102621 [Pleurotus ostreatus PC15]|uniref:Uncharacterized protein n=1 Tax=Pleurotus ostreatus (strain PC15) TaxID=1137138 RepID=A0A067NKG8_PLEO1|nr:hypothetical protein PLEOSDRAFT_1102621 [Pleurotus ostreatus PC15]
MVKRKGVWVRDYDLPSPTYPSASPFPSSSISLYPTPPPVKRARKAAPKTQDPDAPPPEKRLAIFKKKCPQNILERVHRVMQQRFFMVDRRRNGHELREEFSVLGSTGNVYTVTIDKVPSCTCPDSLKGNHCKHILFIFLKVLQVTQASGHWYQKALLTSELQDIFSQAPVAPNAIPVAPTGVREEFVRVTGRPIRVSPSPSPSPSPPASPDYRNLDFIDLTVTPPRKKQKGKDKDKGKEKEKEREKDKRKIPGPDDDCPICYEGMHQVDVKTLEFCAECGKAVHNECFGQWKTTARSKGHDITCVYCRTKWAFPAAAGSTSAAPGAGNARARVSEGYLNLSGVAGLSPVRDTSSCESSPSAFNVHPSYGWNSTRFPVGAVVLSPLV